jgi:hypothetical protein
MQRDALVTEATSFVSVATLLLPQVQVRAHNWCGLLWALLLLLLLRTHADVRVPLSVSLSVGFVHFHAPGTRKATRNTDALRSVIHVYDTRKVITS